MSKKFFKGMLFGGLFSAGMFWLNYTKRGKDLKMKIMEHSSGALKEALKRIPENEWVDKKKVERVIEQVTEEYGRTKELTGAMKNLLAREIKKQWRNWSKK